MPVDPQSPYASDPDNNPAFDFRPHHKGVKLTALDDDVTVRTATLLRQAATKLQRAAAAVENRGQDISLTTTGDIAEDIEHVQRVLDGVETYLSLMERPGGGQ